MNLALITQDFPPEVGGIQTYAKELADRFSRRVDDFFVIAPDDHAASSIDGGLPYPVVRMAGDDSWLGITGLPYAPLKFQHYRTEVAFHTQWQTLPLSILGRKLGFIKHIFVAAHARELLFNSFKKFPILASGFEKYKRSLLSHADMFFPVSQYTAELLQDHGVEENRIQMVINGTDPSRFKPLDTGEAREKLNIASSKVLLTITRLVPRKGIDTALKAFKKVLRLHPESIYLIVGNGKDECRLKKLADELGILKSVRFEGRVSHQDLVTYYNACNIFVMPSKTVPPDVEGFGIVFLEANACGKPTIGTYSGGIPSAIVNNKTGILVDEENPTQLSEAADKLLSDKALADSLGSQGRRWVEQEANWDTSAAKILNCINNTI